MHGKTVCYMHGGKTPKGMMQPAYKTGRYSKYMPARLLERFQQSSDDPDLLNLRDDIALVDSRLSDMLERVDSGESGETWKLAKAAHRTMKAGLAPGGDLTAAKAALDDLDAIISRGMGDYAAWREIGELLDRRERLVRSERRRLVELQQTMTVEQAMLLMGALAALVDEHVTDRAARLAISDGLRRLMSTAGRGAATEEDD